MNKIKKKTTKSSNKKTSAKKVVESPVEPVVETPVVEAPVEPQEPEDNYDAEFTEVKDALKSALDIIKSLNTKVNALEKRVSRDRKMMNKKMKGRVKRVVDPNKPPSGFAKPGPVSDELRKFLKLGKDELIARTEVTKAINAYCKEHDLQNGSDKRKILADAPLRKLLKLNKSDELTFFNLQTYLKVHFPNKEGVYPTA